MAVFSLIYGIEASKKSLSAKTKQAFYFRISYATQTTGRTRRGTSYHCPVRVDQHRLPLRARKSRIPRLPSRHRKTDYSNVTIIKMASFPRGADTDAERNASEGRARVAAAVNQQEWLDKTEVKFGVSTRVFRPV
jgi:hypothetical protein